ncbi:MAG: hypothetical protein QF831_02565 [Candidatus Thalassarchaeaceae archaeon]|jgi:hypothetical protein|nr:hypothetical protein [Candidatus Thalassarchaeaceae archaeon]
MAVAERGSFMWMIVSITQIFLAIKLMDDLDQWLTTLIGASGAACIMIAIVVFREEQRNLLMHPMKTLQKEVNEEQIAKQGKGTWYGIAIWVAAMIFGGIAL